MDPVREVGALLESSGFHPGRSAVDRLRALTVAAQLPADAPARVLAEMDLTADAHRRVGSFSLGMRQRLSLAAAMLGDPPVLVLDEPTNGLDPQRIRWLRGYLRGLADQGRTVFVSSHVLSEVEQIADDVVVIAHGRLVRATSLAELRAQAGVATSVRIPELDKLCGLLHAAGHGFRRVYRRPGGDVLPAHRGRAAMTSLVRAELVKLRSVRMPVWLLLTALGLVVLLVLVTVPTKDAPGNVVSLHWSGLLSRAVGVGASGGATAGLLQLGSSATTRGELLPAWAGALVLLTDAILTGLLAARFTLRRDLT